MKEVRRVGDEQKQREVRLILMIALLTAISETAWTAAPRSVATVKASRTATARPADLDPRIEWLADLGMPQSGGPEPLVKSGSFRLPLGGALTSVVSCGQDVVLCISSTVVRMTRDGGLVWSRSLTDSVAGQWTVVSGDGFLHAVPVSVQREGARIYTFDYDGTLIGSFAWPLLANGLDWVKSVSVAGGVVEAQLTSFNRRISALAIPGATTFSDAVLVPDDLQLGGSGVSDADHTKSFRDGWVVLGVRQDRVESISEEYRSEREAARELNARRARVAKPWVGKRLEIKGLPLFDPTVRGKSYMELKNRMHLVTGKVLGLLPDGGVWLDGGIVNPLRLPLKEFRAASSVAYRAWAPLAALFWPNGRLRGYVIRRAPMGEVFVAGESLFIKSGDHLDRWEPIRK